MINKYLFPNQQRTFAQRLGFSVFAAFSIEDSQVVQRGSHLQCQHVISSVSREHWQAY